jgi:cysteine synthase A
MSQASYPNVFDIVGNTPLIELRALSKQTGCRILGKCEFMNPGGSVKDRAAVSIIKAAEADGSLKPGGVIVEGTAGNTGIGLSVMARARGYTTKIIIPETQTQEKKDALIQAGAELIQVPAKPYKDPNNYIKISGRMAEELNAANPGSAIWANQFDNVANRQAHIDTTAPEIWRQTNGAVDGFVSAVGSGGTLAGTAMGLRSVKPDVKIALADPYGAALYSYYTTGELKSEGSSITEGIGQGRITANLEGLRVDHAYRISDAEALAILFDLIETEGLVLGSSSGVNLAGAVALSRDLGPGHTIVTMLCDGGARYASKMYNKAFLQERDLPLPPWLRG